MYPLFIAFFILEHNFSRVNEQIQKIYDFVDYIYLVTEKKIYNGLSDEVGNILVNDGDIKLISEPKKINRTPSKKSFFQLNKKCLCEFFPCEDDIKYEYKYKIVDKIFGTYKSEILKKILKKIVICSDCYKEKCVIHDFIRSI